MNTITGQQHHSRYDVLITALCGQLCPQPAREAAEFLARLFLKNGCSGWTEFTGGLLQADLSEQSGFE